jgi:endonuclease YncB( thermonuclease family)
MSAFFAVIFLYAIDADTIKVTIPNLHPLFGENVAVRLQVIDAPEKACNYMRWEIGKKWVTEELASAKKIELKDCKKEKYGRLLCRLVYDSKDLATELLEKKLVVRYGEKHQCVKQ